MNRQQYQLAAECCQQFGLSLAKYRITPQLLAEQAARELHTYLQLPEHTELKFIDNEADCLSAATRLTSARVVGVSAQWQSEVESENLRVAKPCTLQVKTVLQRSPHSRASL